MVTLPNFITASRIVLTPFVVLAVLAGNCTRALVLCLIAGFSDGLDGFLARRFDVQSRLGAYLDPVADKLLLTAVYASLGVSHIAPWWLVALVIGRDVFILAMVATAFLFTPYREFPPSIAGKISTCVQILTALVLLAVCAFEARWAHSIVVALLWVTAAATICSGADYAVRGAHQFRNRFKRI
jgi:cardiolipin synthase